MQAQADKRLYRGPRMTVAEQVENLSRNVEELRSEEEVAREEIYRRLSTIFFNLRTLTEDAMRLYEAASVLAPETAELAVEIWDHLYKDFAFVSTVLERIHEANPGVLDLKTPRSIFQDLVTKSSIAILQWDAQAEADSGNPIRPEAAEMLVPNVETLAAIEEGKRDDLKSFNTVAELMADLNADD